MKITNLIILFVFLSACSSKPTAVKKYYRIDPPINAKSESVSTVPATLWIKKPEAHSILGNRPMVATDTDGALQQLSFHAWIESPKILIQEQLQKMTQPGWQSAVTKRPHAEPHYQLHSRILAFEKHQNNAHAHLVIKFYSPEMKLLKQFDLSSTKPLSGENYAAFASAMSAALHDIFKRINLEP